MSDTTIQPTGCCPIFDPVPWQGKEITWSKKLFVKDHVTSFLHVPLNMGRRVTHDMKLIEAVSAEGPEHLMLTDEKSLWGADIYIAVTKPVPGAETVELSGKFLTRVFEGPYKNVGQWAEEMSTEVAAKGKKLKKMYFSYTTCPGCAKAYGKNYVILFAQVD